MALATVEPPERCESSRKRVVAQPHGGGDRLLGAALQAVFEAAIASVDDVIHGRRGWRPRVVFDNSPVRVSAPYRQKLILGAWRVDDPALRGSLIEQNELVIGPPCKDERWLAFPKRPGPRL